MPRRTNEFQQLTHLIQAQLAGTAKVVESAMLTDLVHGDDVEVDLIVQNSVGGVDVTVGFECTAASRPATVEWVREMLSKHDTLPVDKTVLVAKAGFSKAALSRAKARNALAISLEEATDADWLAFVTGLGNLHLGSFTVRSLGGSVNVTPGGIATLAEGQPIRLPRLGVEVTLTEYVTSILSRPDLSSKIIRRWLATPETDRKDTFILKVNFEPQDGPQVQGSDEDWRDINSIAIDVEVQVARTPIELAAGSFDGHHIAFGSAPNIFKDQHPDAQYVLLNLIGGGGRPSKASLLIPGSSSAAPRILEMRNDDSNEHDPNFAAARQAKEVPPE